MCLETDVINELRQQCLKANIKVSEEMKNKACLLVREMYESIKNMKDFDELEILQLKFKKDIHELIR